MKNAIHLTPAAAGTLLFTFLSLTACTTPKPFRGGRATITTGPPGVITQTLAQGDNPSAPSRQSQVTTRTRTYTLPPVTPPRSSPVTVVEREESHATTELGAAQKDTAREIGAKLSSLKSIVWVGLGLFLIGLASLFWPPLKAIVASTTTSAAMVIGGLALIVLPTLIVGNELLIFGAVTLAVGAWFLAHRHGHLRGQLSAAAPESPRRAGFSPQPLLKSQTQNAQSSKAQSRESDYR